MHLIHSTANSLRVAGRPVAGFNFRFLLFLLCCVSAPVLAQEQYKPAIEGPVRTFTTQLPLTTKAQRIQTEIVDGLVVFEGDIILGPVVSFEGNNAVAISSGSARWPNSTIPYELPADHPRKARIEWAINHVQQSTNLCLVPRTNQTDYVRFISASGCSSYVGRQGGRQDIVVGNCSQGSVAHEILHAAGLWHEQSREDRDRYVTINTANITSGKSHNFNKHVSDGTDIGSYDYGSIMHYPAGAFSKNGRPTIVVKTPPGTASTTIGQRSAMSRKDIAAINQLYQPGPCKPRREDCIAFNPSTTSVQKRRDNLYLVVSGRNSLFSAPNRAEAERIAKIIKHYGVNKTCFVGRPDPSMHYFLKGSTAPTGQLEGEDCLAFNPAKLVLKREGSQYLMTDGRSRMRMFPNKAEAEQALAAIKKYGFTRTCYVGRPKPSLTYFRRDLSLIKANKIQVAKPRTIMRPQRKRF